MLYTKPRKSSFWQRLPSTSEASTKKVVLIVRSTSTPVATARQLHMKRTNRGEVTEHAQLRERYRVAVYHPQLHSPANKTEFSFGGTHTSSLTRGFWMILGRVCQLLSRPEDVRSAFAGPRSSSPLAKSKPIHVPLDEARRSRVLQDSGTVLDIWYHEAYLCAKLP